MPTLYFDIPDLWTPAIKELREVQNSIPGVIRVYEYMPDSAEDMSVYNFGFTFAFAPIGAGMGKGSQQDTCDITMRFVIGNVNEDYSEIESIALINKIRNAFLSHGDLGQARSSVRGATIGYVTIAGVPFRALDVSIRLEIDR